MFRATIVSISLSLAFFPISAKALPTSAQIDHAAQIICQVPQESASITRNIYYQELGKWVSEGNITTNEMQDEDTREMITRQLIKQINQTCPERSTELNNQIWSVVFITNN